MNPKTILITGCSSGIGLTSAEILQQRGYRVFATARSENDLNNLKNKGLEAVYLELKDSNSIKAAVEEVLKLCDGRLDALFNNAGYGQPGAMEDISRDALREQFETNVFGYVELTNLVLPVMRSQGHGRIIQNSSVLGLIALAYRGSYVASKFALEGMTNALRIELEGSGIYISSIEPGPISSKFRENAYKHYLKNIRKENSAHKKTYEALEHRFHVDDSATPFTLPASAVTKKLIHALEAKKPKSHYYVTTPTYLLAMARRLLPNGTLHRLLCRVSNQDLKN